MAATVIYKDQTAEVPNAAPEGEDLWIPIGELQDATGWELRPEGACIGEVCVPIPASRQGEFTRDSGSRFNIAALARLMGQPIVHDDAYAAWAFGESGSARRETLASLEAPDFTLPDLDGKMHSLSDHFGKKIFLVSWASW
jgi:hypothetical protein